MWSDYQTCAATASVEATHCTQAPLRVRSATTGICGIIVRHATQIISLRPPSTAARAAVGAAVPQQPWTCTTPGPLGGTRGRGDGEGCGMGVWAGRPSDGRPHFLTRRFVAFTPPAVAFAGEVQETEAARSKLHEQLSTVMQEMEDVRAQVCEGARGGAMRGMRVCHPPLCAVV